MIDKIIIIFSNNDLKIEQNTKIKVSTLPRSPMETGKGLPEPWGSYYSFLLHTGLRAGDVSLLCRDNIDLERGCITSLVRKSRRTHEFPYLTDSALIYPLI